MKCSLFKRLYHTVLCYGYLMFDNARPPFLCELVKEFVRESNGLQVSMCCLVLLGNVWTI